MKTKARIFFAGVGTTFIILGAGFSGGLFMANSALKEPAARQAHAAVEQPPPVRVVLPSPGAAQPVQAPQPIVSPEPQEQLQQPIKEVQAPVEKEQFKAPAEKEQAAKRANETGKADARKADEQRERKKRYAERKAKREFAAARVREQQQQSERRELEEAPIMAFGRDEPRPGGGFNFIIGN